MLNDKRAILAVVPAVRNLICGGDGLDAARLHYQGYLSDDQVDSAPGLREASKVQGAPLIDYGEPRVGGLRREEGARLGLGDGVGHPAQISDPIPDGASQGGLPPL